jgi:hypothetical protein
MVATAAAQRPASKPDSGAFVTRLGADTLALERFVRTSTEMRATVVLRVPRTTLTHYRAGFTSSGLLGELRAVTLAPLTGDTLRVEHQARQGDSIRITIHEGDSTRTRTAAAPSATLPFIDMVHWPYELVTMRAYAMSVDTVRQPLLTGARTSVFLISRHGGDSLFITHPFRGTMRTRVDPDGRLLGLDAGETTRKLEVERRPWVELGAAARRWARLDSAGRGVGALSGRGEARGSIAGATITVDYGRPAKRGREIWGGLVPYGELWRTGANLATHLTTDHPIVLGSGGDTLALPAGRYTLFSIPAADGGVLIVNGETGQNGNAYDAARDIGRVRLTRRALGEPVELFTIEVADGSPAGELRLAWDRSALVVPVRAR